MVANKICHFCKCSYIGQNTSKYCNVQCRADENFLIKERVCKTCGVNKPIENYYIQNAKTNLRKLVCKGCCQADVKERRPHFTQAWKDADKRRKLKWGQDYPDKCTNSRLKSTFGITLDDYNKLLAEQNGVCAICQQTETKIGKVSGELKRLAVDHCHDTNKVRGLLCFHCNSSLGKLKDSVENLQRAIDYLNKSREPETSLLTNHQEHGTINDLEIK